MTEVTAVESIAPFERREAQVLARDEYEHFVVLEARLYDGDSTVALDTIGPWLNRTTTSNVNYYEFGLPDCGGGGQELWVDDLLVDTADWPGPATP